jgi:hypothetical protein
VGTHTRGGGEPGLVDVLRDSHPETREGQRAWYRPGSCEKTAVFRATEQCRYGEKAELRGSNLVLPDLLNSVRSIRKYGHQILHY